MVSDIAKATSVPESYLRKVFQLLARAGLVVLPPRGQGRLFPGACRGRDHAQGRRGSHRRQPSRLHVPEDRARLLAGRSLPRVQRIRRGARRRWRRSWMQRTSRTLRREHLEALGGLAQGHRVRIGGTDERRVSQLSPGRSSPSHEGAARRDAGGDPRGPGAELLLHGPREARRPRLPDHGRRVPGVPGGAAGAVRRGGTRARDTSR